MNQNPEDRSRVTLTLEGHRISSGDFIKGIVSFHQAINAVSDDFAGKPHAVDWVVTVEASSIIVHFDPVAYGIGQAEIPGAIRTIHAGIVKLEEGADEAPPHFNQTAMKAIQKLASIATQNGRGVKVVKISTDYGVQRVSGKVRGAIERVLSAEYSALGSVEGTLQGISSRRDYHVYIYDRLTSDRVTCYFQKDLTEKMLEGFDKRVSVYGRIAYRKDGIPVNITVEDIRIFPSSQGMPTFNDVVGVLE